MQQASLLVCVKPHLLIVVHFLHWCLLLFLVPDLVIKVLVVSGRFVLLLLWDLLFSFVRVLLFKVLFETSNRCCLVGVLEEAEEGVADLYRQIPDVFTLSLQEVEWEVALFRLFLVPILFFGAIFCEPWHRFRNRLELIFDYEATFQYVDLARSQVLMLQEHPNHHLPLVEVFADAEVVLDYFFQVVRLDLLQLRNHLLSYLLLAPIVVEHDLNFALE